MACVAATLADERRDVLRDIRAILLQVVVAAANPAAVAIDLRDVLRGIRAVPLQVVVAAAHPAAEREGTSRRAMTSKMTSLTAGEAHDVRQIEIDQTIASRTSNAPQLLSKHTDHIRAALRA